MIPMVKLSLLILQLIFTTIVIADDDDNKHLKDGEIIAIYNQVNSFDIESALLALSKSINSDVKALATQVSSEHRGVRLAAAQLAQPIDAKVKLPKLRQKSALQFYNTMDTLSKLDGDAFEQAYLLHEIEFHQQAIQALKKILIPATRNRKLIKHFKSVLPHFKRHLEETKRIAKELGYYS